MTPDIIGTIYEPTGNTLTDSEGNEYPELQATEGYHVNFAEDVPELAAYKVDPQPATPYRVYAGNVQPVAYVFSGESEWNLVKAQFSDSEGNLNLTPPPPRPPAKVTMRQARLALSAAGILPNVDAAINALEEPQRTVARIEWDYSQEVERDRELVNVLGPALGLTDEQLDELFREAEKL